MIEDGEWSIGYLLFLVFLSILYFSILYFYFLFSTFYFLFAIFYLSFSIEEHSNRLDLFK